jgi:hypothetical protein
MTGIGLSASSTPPTSISPRCPRVDQLVLEQPAHLGAASVHLQLTARLGLELADRCDLPGRRRLGENLLRGRR